MKIVRFTVTLLDVVPEVKRVIEVQDSLPLDYFHMSLQLSMGWLASHMHAFHGGNREWGDDDTVSDLVKATGGKQIIYEYDFGDCWAHLLEAGKPKAPVKGEIYPRIVSVTNSCPPEDCGGPDGYHDLLRVLADPKDPDHEDMLDWVGGSFDPLKPDVEDLKEDMHSFATEQVSKLKLR